MELSQRNAIGTLIVNGVFLIVLNLTLMFIIGYMTLDSWANINSRFAGLLLSFFMPFFIVYKTMHLSNLERLLKFGSGFGAYIVMAIFMVGFPQAFTTGLIPCLILAMATLYYGDIFLKRSE